MGVQAFRTFASSTDASEVDLAACVFCYADAFPTMSKTATATRVVCIGGSGQKTPATLHRSAGQNQSGSLYRHQKATQNLIAPDA
ncbi:MAG: hypothetical protein DMG77_11525 [Acidobacteria bacterium]|nr:MAG: hypothetical protein DMG77_11525 [Acidobacteriota bacterium]